MDPYDFIATHLPTDTRNAISRFWEKFIESADELDQAFESKDSARIQASIGVMDALRDISPDLMWEFGPSDRGHSLCVTAEWRDELRPLARLINKMAPDLPRWVFLEARTPDEGRFSPENFSARFQKPLIVNDIEAKLGGKGRIDLIAKGEGDAGELESQALSIATMVLGEEVERDWVGFVDGEEARSGMLGFLKNRSRNVLDPAVFADRFRSEIARAKSAMSDIPYSKLSLDERAVSLFEVNQLPEDHRRSDLFMLSATDPVYGEAVLSSPRFSSRCYSLHDEWFMYLRVPRTDEMSFDDVGDRYDIEALLHENLSADDLGGFVAGGHGQAAVYIDFAVTNVELAVVKIGQALTDKAYAQEATLHFMDSGLEFNILPAVPANPQPN